MNCFSQRFRQTAPMLGSSKNELVPSKPPRRNGWSWPPQAFQVVGWLVYSYLTIVSFGIYIPLLPLPWKHVAYTVSLTHSGSFLFEYGANISLFWGVFFVFFLSVLLNRTRILLCGMSVWASVTPSVTDFLFLAQKT